MKSDIEIAREVSLRKIKEIATGLGIPREEVQTTQSYPGYSHHSYESGYR